MLFLSEGSSSLLSSWYVSFSWRLLDKSKKTIFMSYRTKKLAFCLEKNMWVTTAWMVTLLSMKYSEMPEHSFPNCVSVCNVIKLLMWNNSVSFLRLPHLSSLPVSVLLRYASWVSFRLFSSKCPVKTMHFYMWDFAVLKHNIWNILSIV